MKYSNKKTGVVVNVIDLMAVGMGDEIGTTFIIYKFNTDLDFHRVMNSKEFLKTYEKI